MIAAALLLMAAAPQSAIDAERAFAAMAQTKGQWTAFRAFAAPDAIMFVPEAGNALAFLKDRADPPVPVSWWPAKSWVSCDGGLAVNTGPWLRAGGTSSGTFTTVWKRQGDGSWNWLFDDGRPTPRAVSAGEKVPIAKPVCRNLAGAAVAPPSQESRDDLLVQLPNAMPSGQLPNHVAEEGAVVGSGVAVDGSLRWEARAMKGGEQGAHMLRVWTWDGSRHRLALFELSGVATQ